MDWRGGGFKHLQGDRDKKTHTDTYRDRDRHEGDKEREQIDRERDNDDSIRREMENCALQMCASCPLRNAL